MSSSIEIETWERIQGFKDSKNIFGTKPIQTDKNGNTYNELITIILI